MINENRLTNTITDLIQIDSPSGEEHLIADDLKRRFTELGFDTTNDSYGNVIARYGTGTPILLSAHMDTVEPGRAIEPQIIGSDIVSGDHTILGGDCKAGISGILEGITSVIEDGRPLKTIEVVFTRQEEIGLVGAKNLDFSLIQSEEAIVFDGEGPVTQITSSSPTHVRFEANITGKSAHAGVEPEKGISAIKIAADLINRLPQGRLDSETTFNIGIIEGGSVTNAVPENTIIKGEFRSHNSQVLDGIKVIVDQAVEEVRNIHSQALIEVDMTTQFAAYSISDSGRCLNRVKNALDKLGLSLNMHPSGGGTDGNVFRLNGIDAVVVGMGSHNAHTTREYVHIPELIDVAKFCEAIVSND